MMLAQQLPNIAESFVFARYTAYGYRPGPVFSYELRYIVGFWLVEMVITTNEKPTIYRNLYEYTGPGR